MRTINRAATLIGFTLLLAACSSEELGSPTVNVSQPSASETSGLWPNPYTVPPEKGLDVAPFLGNPCGLVSPGLLADEKYSVEGRPRLPGEDTTADVTGPYCGWSGKGDSRGLTVSIQSGNARRGAGGLVHLRRMYDEGRYAYWEDTSIGGYPAAYLDLADRRSAGGCGVAVAVADDMSFSVAVDAYADQPTEACSAAARFAEDVLGNLERGI
ncbi:DUF3558 domain-containing protein [Saccharomonospora azurea]|uniref:DUF3558 domain-containing protein n=1 Tax=Saccharomonospora azurea NA-128 TaxID=882081 RepID=H8GCB7_9PSEU|nr:DUF3558 domain-containing protein [Saccharomonospora azurea]EHY88751.1 Protein of unknown function (DUF3558) [Saccharomonospora azurea NA-128]